MVVLLCRTPEQHETGDTSVDDTGDDEFVDEFLDDGLAWNTNVPPLEGPFIRPNGKEHVPRSVAGIQDAAFIDRCHKDREHVLFYGPPGTGKTSLPEAVMFRDALKGPDGSYIHYGMESLVCEMDTTTGDFFGSYIQDPETGTFIWDPGPLHRAVMYDIPIYVDEVFMADPRVLISTLYPLMDGRDVLRIPANPSLGTMTVGPGFFVICAGNPDEPGANYAGALRDRVSHQIEVETDWTLAVELGVPRNVVAKARILNEKRRKGLISWSPQLRALLDYLKQKNSYSKDYALAALLGKTPPRDREEVAKTLRSLAGRDTSGEFKVIRPLEMGPRHGR